MLTWALQSTPFQNPIGFTTNMLEHLPKLSFLTEYLHLIRSRQGKRIGRFVRWFVMNSLIKKKLCEWLEGIVVWGFASYWIASVSEQQDVTYPPAWSLWLYCLSLKYILGEVW